jgi:hypothetical protein
MSAPYSQSQIVFHSEMPRPTTSPVTPSDEFVRNMPTADVQAHIEFHERRTQAIDHSGLWDV